MALMAVLIAVCSWISIQTVVPFTLQTFAVFCALELLGGVRGTMAVAVYLLLGAVGVPVFAGFTGGLGILLGTTGGYLLGFLLTGLVYWLFERLGHSLWLRVAALLVGLFLCYAFGTLWFVEVYSRANGPLSVMTALGWCVLPFLLPDGLKLALALLLSARLRPLLKLEKAKA
jgi:biotin transport system substrate-specific component